MNKRNIIIISIIVGILIIIALVIYSLTPKAYIKFTTAPQQVIVSIASSSKQSINRAIKNEGIIRVAPGHYIITVSQDEFGSYIKEVDITNKQTVEFLVALTPLTDAARELIKDDKSQAIVQRFYGDMYTQQTDKITKNYPILSILPIKARLYMVYACASQKYPDDTTKIALCVDEGQSDVNLKPYVIKDLQSRGYNPTDYEIIWTSQSS